MKYGFLIALGILLAFSTGAYADDSEPPTGTVALLCKMSQHSELLTQIVSIDYDRKTVNEVPATFTTSVITWIVDNGSHKEHHELNRVTGTYFHWTEGETATKPMPTFTCEKAAPKF